MSSPDFACLVLFGGVRVSRMAATDDELSVGEDMDTLAIVMNEDGEMEASSNDARY